MKKGILTTLAILCTLPMFAEFNLGVKGGYTTTLSFANIGEAQWSNLSTKNAQGFHAGLFARAGGVVYFQPEVLYNREISETAMNIDGIGDIRRQATTSTVDIPLLFGWRIFRINDVFNMRFVIGPKVRFNAGSGVKYKAEDGSWTAGENYTDDMHVAAVGLDTGIGFEFFDLLNIEMRYNLISDLYKQTSFGESVSTNYKDPLNTFNVSLGIKLWK